MKQIDYSFVSLRGLAIILVVYIHVSSLGYQSPTYSLNFNLTVVLRQIANFAVPLFLFLSGYFLAKKEFTNFNSYAVYIKKQLPRVLLPYIIWGLLYSIKIYTDHFDTKTIILKLLTFRSSGPFYFIFLICQYYFLAPILIKISNIKYGLTISLIISIFSCVIIQYIRYVKGIDLPLVVYGGAFTTWLIFPILGIYISKNKLHISNSKLAFFTILFLCLSIIASYYLIYNFNDPNNATSAVKVSSFLYSISIILFLFQNRERFLNIGLLTKVGEYSFGVFFSHMFVLSSLTYGLYLVFDKVIYANIISQLLLTILVIFTCLFFGNLLHKINRQAASKYFGF